MSKAHWVALASISGIGSVMARKLRSQFGSVAAIFQASDEQLLRTPRFTPLMLATLRTLQLEKFQAELDTLTREGIAILTWDDAAYPIALRDLNDAPILLYLRGTFTPQDETAVAIVGTRSASKQGIEIASKLARELAARGLSIVSGLEQGIDSAAHFGALQLPNGRNVAIVGSGLHTMQTQTLAQRIARHGVVLSEFAPDIQVRALNLKARDRLINALTRAVIVVEANLNSAALSTAERAKHKGNLVYAIAGSEGTEQLLRDGAKPLNLHGLDFDTLADEISKHTLTKTEGTASPLQANLF